MLQGLSVEDARVWYDSEYTSPSPPSCALLPRDLRRTYIAARKWFAILPAATFPVTFFVNAPFGRFALKDHSIFQVDGKPYLQPPRRYQILCANLLQERILLHPNAYEALLDVNSVYEAWYYIAQALLLTKPPRED